jgi:hypothetical protein
LAEEAAAVTRRHAPLAIAGVALLLALILALAARDVRLWNESVAEGDERFQISPGPDGLWEPDPGTFTAGVVPSLLALDDDLRLREAAQLFRRSRPRSETLRTPHMLSFATSAQVRFAQIQQSDAPPRLRSIAANELGALAFAEMVTDPTQARDHARRATQKFIEAVLLDPTNAAARHNLELIQTMRQEGRGALGFDEGDASGPSAGAGSTQGGTGF